MESKRALIIESKQFGKQRTVDLDDFNGTVANLKGKIYELTNIPVDQQHLLINESPLLEDQRTLASYGVGNHSVLELMVGCFITLETKHGTFLYEDNRRQTVQNLKSSMSKIPGGLFKSDLYVFFGNQLLEDENTLSSYGVQNKSILRIEQKQDHRYVIITSPAVEPIFILSDNLNVRYLKKRLCALKGYPVDHVNLIFRDQILEDQRTLSSYKIQYGSPIHMELRTPMVLIKISTEPPSVLYLDDLHGTVENLKGIISYQEGFPKESQTLIFRGRTLEDDACLSSSGVQSGSLINLKLDKCAVLMKPYTGNPNFLLDDLSVTVGDLKRKIHALTGIEENQLMLCNRSSLLLNEKANLSSIENISAIHVLAKNMEETYTFIRVKGMIHLKSLFLPKTVYVADLKARIQECTNILGFFAGDCIKLLFGTRQLEDGQSLSSYGIQQGSVIMIVLRVEGGGYQDISCVIRLEDTGDRQGETRRSTESLQELMNFRCCIS